MMLSGSTVALAQITTPGNAIPPPDDTPSVRVGGTVFLDYTHTSEPKTTDTDGNLVSSSAFNVARTYINVTGQLNGLPAFESHPISHARHRAAARCQEAWRFRLKYGFVQFNLDDWLWRENATGNQ